ncbi:glycosyl hydrolase 53 family protein [bacterium]|nr:glycosyl hydrolase 53 family protein [bacterium]
MKYTIWHILCFCCPLLIISNGLAAEPGIIKGADVSFLPQIQDLGGVYKDNGVPGDPLKILKDHGFNLIRLKLWHTPADPYNNLEKILMMARRIRERELQFLLDIHYSDTWADPGRQNKPAAWSELDFETLRDSVQNYTRNVIAALNNQGTTPDMVQIGNEIISGMLWNDGRVGGGFNTGGQWDRLADLIQGAVQGIRESGSSGDSVRIMIHIDRGGDNAGSRWFFDHLIARSVAFDVIGLSFYPWWHGSLNDLRINLNDLAKRYGKDIVVVETAYPWTLQWADAVPNILGNAGDLLAGYPASVDGQTKFLRDLIRIIRNTDDQRAIGLVYWAPEYISVDPIGSPWENNTLFDFEGNALPAMDVFKEEPSDLAPVQVTVRLNTSTLADTLSEMHVVQIRGELSGLSSGSTPDGRMITWDSDSEIILQNRGGDYWETSFQMLPGDRLDYKFWTGFSSTKGTFQRLGWEGPVNTEDGLSANTRVFVAGTQDSVLTMQYYNSESELKQQYWQPFRSTADSVAVLFRVNMGKETVLGRFDPDLNGPVTVRGDERATGGMLTWEASNLVLSRETFSVNDGSFWSGVGYLPKSALESGDTVFYAFYIENASENAWEDHGLTRFFIVTESLLNTGSDTTLHWDFFEGSQGQSGIEAHSGPPCAFRLNQNYPNPFNAVTTISYEIPGKTLVSLKIYNMLGEQIAVLKDGELPGGFYRIRFDGSGLGSGSYIYRLSAGRKNAARQFQVIK